MMTEGSETSGRRRAIVMTMAAGLATVLANVITGASMAGLAAQPMTAAPVASGSLKLVALGDSLTAGYGLPGQDAFPAQLERALRQLGHNIVIDNAGVSGDTAEGGLDRVDWSVGEGVAGVILALGANNALRGLPPADTKAALDGIIRRLKARGIAVMLAGMRAPPNMGSAYATAFDAIYPDLAAAHGLILYPFFLDGVAAVPALNLPDGIHPTAAGIRTIVGHMLPTVERFVATLGRAG